MPPHGMKRSSSEKDLTTPEKGQPIVRTYIITLKKKCPGESKAATTQNTPVVEEKPFPGEETKELDKKFLTCENVSVLREKLLQRDDTSELQNKPFDGENSSELDKSDPDEDRVELQNKLFDGENASELDKPNPDEKTIELQNKPFDGENDSELDKPDHDEDIVELQHKDFEGKNASEKVVLGHDDPKVWEEKPVLGEEKIELEKAVLVEHLPGIDSPGFLRRGIQEQLPISQHGQDSSSEVEDLCACAKAELEKPVLIEHLSELEKAVLVEHLSELEDWPNTNSEDNTSELDKPVVPGEYAEELQNKLFNGENASEPAKPVPGDDTLELQNKLFDAENASELDKLDPDEDAAELQLFLELEEKVVLGHDDPTVLEEKIVLGHDDPTVTEEKPVHGEEKTELEDWPNLSEDNTSEEAATTSLHQDDNQGWFEILEEATTISLHQDDNQGEDDTANPQFNVERETEIESGTVIIPPEDTQWREFTALPEFIEGEDFAIPEFIGEDDTPLDSFTPFRGRRHSNPPGLGCELASGGCSPTITEMTAAEAAALALEERPSSSMSTASRASGSTRIPRLNRAASMRLSKGEQIRAKEGRHNHGSSPKPLVRSQSFVSSRGMKTASSPQSPSSPSNNSLQLPQTPNSARHMSPGSLTPDPQRRLSFTNHRRPSERKHNSYAGLGSPPWSTGGHSSGRHSFHSTLRRPNFLPLSQSTSNLYSGHSSMPVTPVSHPESPSRGTPESQDLDDVETASVGSCDSVSSAVSCDAGMARHHHHGHGKDRRYMLHCRHNHEPDPDSYLTPTQRAARKIRELKSQLAEARREVHVRDAEISRLTRELVELRLCKARSTQDDDKRKVEMPRENGDVSVDGTTPSVPSATPPHKLSATPSEGSEPELSRLMDNIHSGLGEAAGTSGTSPATASLPETTSDSVDLARSLADSGHYDDLTSPCLSSRDPFEAHRGFGAGSHRTDDEEEDRVRDTWAAIEETETRLRLEFDRREEELKRNHMNEYHELKEKHNDKVESLLSKLSDANLKYFELRPQYDHSQEKIRELEKEVGRVKEELAEAERRHQKMYLQMFIKGQQAARMQQDDEHSIDSISMSESAVSVCELMKKLSHTEDELEKLKALNRREASSKNNNNLTTKNNNNNRELDPEVTLQFLKSAIYYFLTDKDNSRGHLRAIESILGYTDSEKCSIDKVVKI